MANQKTIKGRPCPQLKAMQQLPHAEILGRAFILLSRPTLQALFGTLVIDEPRLKRVLLASRSQKTRRLLLKLAETLYYNKGARLCQQKRWNEMTRLQLENEVLKRGMANELEEEKSELKLRIMLAAATVKEREERNAKKVVEVEEVKKVNSI